MATCFNAGIPAAIGYSLVWFIMFGGWVIELAGVGRVTELCMDLNTSDAGDVNCGYFHALDWWTIALQFVGVVLALVAMFTEGLNRGIVSSIIAISTVQLTIQANTYFTAWRSLDVGMRPDSAILYGENARLRPAPSTDSDIGLAVSTVCAGNIIELVGNYFWLLVFAKFVTAGETKAADPAKP